MADTFAQTEHQIMKNQKYYLRLTLPTSKQKRQGNCQQTPHRPDRTNTHIPHGIGRKTNV